MKTKNQIFIWKKQLKLKETRIILKLKKKLKEKMLKKNKKFKIFKKKVLTSI